MRKEKWLVILGVWIAVLPYLGFPSLWKNILLTITGLGLTVWGFLEYRKLHRGEGRGPDNFSENHEFSA